MRVNKLEVFVEHSMPYVFVLLSFLIIVEFTHLSESYYFYLRAGDFIVVSFFAVDLSFKWMHAKRTLTFLRLYWIDLVAIFPFYFFFRFYRAVSDLVLITEEAQRVVHEAQLARELKVLRETESAAKALREGRILRATVRFLRLIRARWYILHNKINVSR